MNKEGDITTNYGNWVSTRIIAIPIAMAVISAILSVVSPYFMIPTCIFVIVSDPYVSR